MQGTVGATGPTGVPGYPLTRTLVTSPSYVSSQSDQYIGVNHGNLVTINLAPGVTSQGIVIKDESGLASSNQITIVPAIGEVIDGASSSIISTNGGSITIWFNGGKWWIIGRA